MEQRPSGGPPKDASDHLYEADHLVQVDIAMEPLEWDRIRNEGRSVTGVFSGCDKGYDYGWANATVTVDGVTKTNVAVRKKGFLGSLSQVKPALKIDFNRIVKGQEVWGVESLTLNNDKQDASHTHQCLAYQLFRAANSPAPRCNFAKVTVNGEALGIFSNVESLKKDFLARHFEDNDGNLYEGAGGADFDPVAITKLELKTNEEDNDRSDIDRVVEAMKVDDADLYRSLESLIDMDAFMTFWAMESITGHWDGYAGNRNNYYLYHDPTTDKFYFIPWGTDGAFYTGHANLASNDLPKSVYAWSWLTYRLYGNPEVRAKYQERVRLLLDKVWNESLLLGEVDRMGALTAADERALESQRTFIRTRKQTIIEELDRGAPDWKYRPPSRAKTTDCLPGFTIEGSFDTAWGDLTSGLTSSPGSFFRITDADKLTRPISFDLHTKEINQSYAMTWASSGFDTGDGAKVASGSPTIWILGLQGASGTNVVVSLMFARARFGARELPFFALETFGAVARSMGQGNNQVLGFIGDGKVTFDEVGTEPGSRVRGSFKGVFMPTISDQLKQ